MNKLKVILSSFAMASCANVSYASDIITNMAHLQAMDKITGRVSEVYVPVNGVSNFGTFSILVRKCVTKSPEETPENIAFIDIVDNYQTANPINIFKGWMFSSTPALNAVEHPIYDIWLLKCYNSASKPENTLTAEQLSLRDTIPMVRPHPSKITPKLETNELISEPHTILESEIEAEPFLGTEEKTTSKNYISEKTKEENIEIIKININNEEDGVSQTSEEEFVSEGEEVIEDITEEISATEKNQQETSDNTIADNTP